MSETTKLSIQEMRAQLAALQAKIAEASAHETNEALDKIRALIAEHGLTAQQIFPTQATSAYKKSADVNTGDKKETNKAAPKYVDPVSGKLWSGRGLAPKWIAHETPEGRTKYLINKPAQPEALPLV